MKTTTKLLALLLAVCMLACLMAGCAKPETQDTKDPVTLPGTRISPSLTRPQRKKRTRKNRLP